MENLKILRSKLGISQTQVAKTLEISQQAYANYENGNRQPDNIMINRIADYFNVTTDYLLGRDEQKEIHPSEMDERILKLTSQYKEAERLLDLYAQLSPDQQKTILDLAGVYIAQQEKDNKE